MDYLKFKINLSKNILHLKNILTNYFGFMILNHTTLIDNKTKIIKIFFTFKKSFFIITNRK